MGSKSKTKEKKNTVAVSNLHSMRTSVCILAAISVLVSVIVCIATAVPSFKKDIQKTNMNYLLDNAIAYGKSLDGMIEDEGLEAAMSYDRLHSMLADVKIQGCSTSYTYVVDKDGVMLYHPTQDKVGNPVENSMVKGLVADIQAGKNLAFTSDAIQYEYKGAKKFASYFVGTDNDFILIVTVDYNEIFAELNSLVVRSILIGIGIYVVVMIISIIMATKMTQPLVAITNIINKLGNLDLSANEGTEFLKNRKDESGVMARAVSNLRHELIDIVSELNKQSEELATTNDEFTTKFTEIAESVSNVNVAVEEIAEGSTSQAQETTSAGEQVANIGMVIEDNAKNVDRLEDTVTTMNKLSDVASETLTKLEAINQQTTDNINIVSDQTNSTNASAAKIQEAVSLIQDIASQTNLLSLNASIEAARAGEAGRGFAVVAEEIRKLADDSAASADEISQIVDELIANSNSSVGKMAEVTEDSKQQREGLVSTIDSFSQLRDCVQEISDASRDIFVQTSNLERQKDLINGVVEQLAAISEENAASTEETSASMQTLSEAIQTCQEDTVKLNELSQSLMKEVNKFTL